MAVLCQGRPCGPTMPGTLVACGSPCTLSPQTPDFLALSTLPAGTQPACLQASGLLWAMSGPRPRGRSPVQSPAGSRGRSRGLSLGALRGKERRRCMRWRLGESDRASREWPGWVKVAHRATAVGGPGSPAWPTPTLCPGLSPRGPSCPSLSLTMSSTNVQGHCRQGCDPCLSASFTAM